MTGTTLAIVLAVASAVAALAGTIYTQRKNGPEFTKAVLGSQASHLARLDAEITSLQNEQVALRAQIAGLQQALAVERVYTGVLIKLMEEAGIEVPPRPDPPDLGVDSSYPIV